MSVAAENVLFSQAFLEGNICLYWENKTKALHLYILDYVYINTVAN